MASCIEKHSTSHYVETPISCSTKPFADPLRETTIDKLNEEDEHKVTLASTKWLLRSSSTECFPAPLCFQTYHP